jgi:hypothetical protein
MLLSCIFVAQLPLNIVCLWFKMARRRASAAISPQYEPDARFATGGIQLSRVATRASGNATGQIPYRHFFPRIPICSCLVPVQFGCCIGEHVTVKPLTNWRPEDSIFQSVEYLTRFNFSTKKRLTLPVPVSLCLFVFLCHVFYNQNFRGVNEGENITS